MTQSAPKLTEIRDILKSIKYVTDVIDWNTKPENSNFWQTKAVILDENYTSIPGVTMDIQVKARNANVEDVYKFILFKRVGLMKYRIFSIETGPSYKRTHFDKKHGAIYGTHIHLGDQDYLKKDFIVKKVVGGTVADDFKRWGQRFCRHSSLGLTFPLELPEWMSSDLF